MLVTCERRSTFVAAIKTIAICIILFMRHFSYNVINEIEAGADCLWKRPSLIILILKVYLAETRRRCSVYKLGKNDSDSHLAPAAYILS